MTKAKQLANLLSELALKDQYFKKVVDNQDNDPQEDEYYLAYDYKLSEIVAIIGSKNLLFFVEFYFETQGIDNRYVMHATKKFLNENEPKP